jgi:serine/threonine-protein kinase
MAIGSKTEPFIDQFKIGQQVSQDRYKSYALAEDTDSDRFVLVASLREPYTDDPDFSHSFLERASTLSQISHPNLTRVLGSGKGPNGRAYIATEPVEGYPLSERLARLKQQQATAHILYALTLLRQIASGLALAEKLGLYHFELTPAHITLKNITLKTDDSVIVTDLDIPASAENPTPDAALLPYLAPEQKAGRQPDGASEVYSLGAMLFELLSGEPPQSSQGLTKRVTGWIRGTSMLAQQRPDLASETYALVERALQHNPRRRYQTVTDFLTALDEAVEAEELRIHTGQYIPLRQGHPVFLIPFLALFLCIALALATQQLLPIVPTSVPDSTNSALARELLAGAPAEPTKTEQPTPESPTPVHTLAAAVPTSTAVPTTASTRTPFPSPTNSPTHTPTAPPTAVTDPSATPPATFRVDVSSANLRRGPGTNYEVDGYVLRGQSVVVLARNDGAFIWYNVETEDGRSGWVAADIGSPTGPDGLAEVAVAATIPVPPTPTPTPTPTSTPSPTATQPPVDAGPAGSGGAGSGGGSQPSRPTPTPAL